MNKIDFILQTFNTNIVLDDTGKKVLQELYEQGIEEGMEIKEKYNLKYLRKKRMKTEKRKKDFVKRIIDYINVKSK